MGMRRSMSGEKEREGGGGMCHQYCLNWGERFNPACCWKAAAELHAFGLSSSSYLSLSHELLMTTLINITDKDKGCGFRVLH